MECKHCGRPAKSKNSNVQHELRCKANPTGPQVKPSYGMLGKKGANQYTKGTAKPLSDETRRKRSEIAKKQVWTDARRAKHSASMKLAVLNNPDSYTKNNVCGRVKNIEYNGAVLKGQWELTVAKWLDSQLIRWENEPAGFPYTWKESTHLYYPDFFLPDYNVYIEVKGYKTERDDAKWTQFPNTLVVIDSKTIHSLTNRRIEDFLGP